MIRGFCIHKFLGKKPVTKNCEQISEKTMGIYSITSKVTSPYPISYPVLVASE
jgi:hypothetical protein